MDTRLLTQLRQVRLLQDCSERDRRLVARHLERIAVGPDTTLIRRGDPATNVFFLLGGRVEVRDGGAARELAAGEHVGELALLRGTPSDLDAVTSTDCELGVLGARMFRVLTRDLEPFNRALLTDLATRVADSAGSVNSVALGRPAYAALTAGNGPEATPRQRHGMVT